MSEYAIYECPSGGVRRYVGTFTNKRELVSCVRRLRRSAPTSEFSVVQFNRNKKDVSFLSCIGVLTDL